MHNTIILFLKLGATPCDCGYGHGQVPHVGRGAIRTKDRSPRSHPPPPPLWRWDYTRIRSSSVIDCGHGHDRQRQRPATDVCDSRKNRAHSGATGQRHGPHEIIPLKGHYISLLTYYLNNNINFLPPGYAL